jgi:branched-chain amino acid aminotransferase
VNTYINFNGKTVGSDQPVIHSNNRGFRYGDGVFETIRVKDGHIVLADYHFERLFSSLQLLQFEIQDGFNKDELSRQILDLCKTNGHQASARIRLVVFRSDGFLTERDLDFPNYIIETYTLPPLSPVLIQDGLKVGVFSGGRKSQDQFSQLKSNNYLLNSMAVRYASKQNWNDCLILNSKDRICESTVCNVFCTKKGIIYTPSITEGCVAGVMRRHLLENLGKEGYRIEEIRIEMEFLIDSDEVFLTNAIHGIRWVDKIGERLFSHELSGRIYQSLILHLF